MNRIDSLKRNRLCFGLLAMSLLNLFVSFPAFAAGKKEGPNRVTKNAYRTVADVPIRGIVKDRLGAPLAGVTVQVVGNAAKSTTTDSTGRFSILAPEKGSIQFSYIGYKPQVVPVNALEIELVMDAVEGNLEEVVVVGFGRQRKVSLIGAQSTINAEELQLPVANITTALAGRISGVVGVQRSGEPGRDGADLWIRGISTFGSSSPLVIVDGVIGRSLNNLDPEDIASFSILKDASATAVYGVNGANGVIIVTTKRGKIGKIKITADYQEGMTWLTQVPKVADGVTYMNLVNESLTTRGGAPRFRPGQIDSTGRGLDPLLYPNVDWMDAVFKQYGRNRRANLNISGGSSSAQYYISLGYYNESGILRTDVLNDYNTNPAFTRYNFTSNINVDITRSTKLDLGLQGYVSNANYPGEQTQDIFLQALVVPPVEFPKIYPGGFVPGRSSNGGQRNPFADLTRRGYRNEFRNQIYSNLRVTQNLGSLTKGLTLSGMFAFDAFNSHNIDRRKRENTYFPNAVQPYKADGTLNLVQTYTGTGNYLAYARGNGGDRKFYFETSLNYDRRFGDHNIGGLLLFNQDDRTDGFAGNFIASIPFRSRGVAARTTYSYKDRYFAEGNFGYNGSESFAPDKRFGFFPSVGVGWVVSNENFFKPVSNAVQFFKLRYSDGLVGASDLGGRRFGYIDLLADNGSTYNFGSNNQGPGDGILVTDFAIDVTWSTARKQNLGVELRTLKNNLNITVDFFKEYRTGILIGRNSVPRFVGLTNSPIGNVGIVQNKGIDGLLEYNLRISDVKVGLRVNATYNQDKIIEDDRPTPLHPWLQRRGNNLLAIYGYEALGLFKSQDEINASPTPGDRSIIKPGDIKYRDVNADGLINANDYVKIGRGDVPSFVYGFGLNVNYKGFNLNAFFQGTSDADRLISGTGIFPFSTDGGTSNAYAIATDRWTEGKPGGTPFYPRLAYGEANNFNNTQPSSWWIKEMSFLRLKSAELSYTFPKGTLSKLGAQNTRLYLIGTNLLTFSKWKVWDPELNTNNGSRYPNISVVSAGLNVQF